jgi:peptide chain release factor 1
MSFDEKLDKILAKHASIEQKLIDISALEPQEYVKLSKELAELEQLVHHIKSYKKSKDYIASLESLIASIAAPQDSELAKTSTDHDLKDIATQELAELKKSFPEQEYNLKLALLPKDEADAKNVILEVRAGAGGSEAALFAAELFGMYHKYAESMGWKFEVLSISDTGIGGYKEASATISGRNVFSKLKFESGVHRVQRVPVTESCGRIHTSTATVAILPEAEEIDVEIQDKDLRLDIFRASGAGGQHVNTTESAVRITHIPTGIVVQQQDERSQHKNKAKAMKILRSRLYELQRQKQAESRASSRKDQVGTGDRSERIRTYNFPQGRVTDHRINVTLYKIDSIVGEGQLSELLEAIAAYYEAKRLGEEL